MKVKKKKCRKLHNKKLKNLYSLPNRPYYLDDPIKGYERNGAHTISVGDLKGRHNLGDLDVKGRK